MIRIKEVAAERYQHHEGWENGKPTYYWVTIINTPLEYEAWVQKEDEGIAALMFGIPKHQPTGLDLTYEGFIELVEGNLEASGAESYLKGVR